MSAASNFLSILILNYNLIFLPYEGPSYSYHWHNHPWFCNQVKSQKTVFSGKHFTSHLLFLMYDSYKANWNKVNNQISVEMALDSEATVRLFLQKWDVSFKEDHFTYTRITSFNSEGKAIKALPLSHFLINPHQIVDLWMYFIEEYLVRPLPSNGEGWISWYLHFYNFQYNQLHHNPNLTL